MPKFRKKPIVVEAEQFKLSELPLPFSPEPVCCLGPNGWFVTTIHGQDTPIEDGDWIILEEGGHWEAYPCKPDIFEMTYEPVLGIAGAEAKQFIDDVRACSAPDTLLPSSQDFP